MGLLQEYWIALHIERDVRAYAQCQSSALEGIDVMPVERVVGHTPYAEIFDSLACRVCLLARIAGIPGMPFER